MKRGKKQRMARALRRLELRIKINREKFDKEPTKREAQEVRVLRQRLGLLK